MSHSSLPNITVSIIEPVGAHGGMNYYDYGLSLGLGKAGCKVIYFTCSETEKRYYQNVLVYQTFDGVWQINNNIKKFIVYFSGFLQSLYTSKKEKAEIVHLHLFRFDLLFIINLFFTKIMNFKVILTIHDIDAVSGKNLSIGIQKFVYNWVDKIILHNQFSYREAKKRITAAKLVVIPHGNYLPFIKEPSPNLQKSINKKFELLFFGQINKVKGLDILIEALGILKKQNYDFNLTIAGKVWKDNFFNYQFIIKEHGLENNIRINLNYIPDEMVPDYFNNADLVVLPYKRIYQSGVLLKAMSYGKVVLVSDLEPFIEIIKDGENGYIFKSEDYTALANKLIEIISNRENLPDIGDKALKYVKKDHDWIEIGKRTFSLYKEVGY